MQSLSPRVHGVIDSLLVVALALAPPFLEFSGVPATLCYVLAVVHLMLTMLTSFPLGGVRLIPFGVHRGVEVMAAALLMLAPWLFRFAQSAPDARNFFLATGAILGLLYLLTSPLEHAPLPPRKEQQPA